MDSQVVAGGHGSPHSQSRSLESVCSRGRWPHILGPGTEHTGELCTSHKPGSASNGHGLSVSCAFITYNVHRHFSLFRHGVQSASLAPSEMDLYPEICPCKSIKHTRAQMWDDGKSTLEESRNVGVGKSR